MGERGEKQRVRDRGEKERVRERERDYFSCEMTLDPMRAQDLYPSIACRESRLNAEYLIIGVSLFLSCVRE